MRLGLDWPSSGMPAGERDGSWQVDLPAEEVPPELPEPLPWHQLRARRDAEEGLAGAGRGALGLVALRRGLLLRRETRPE